MPRRTRLTDAGPMMTEASAGAGGDGIPVLWEFATWVSLDQQLITVRLGEKQPPSRVERIAHQWYLPQGVGRLRDGRCDLPDVEPSWFVRTIRRARVTAPARMRPQRTMSAWSTWSPTPMSVR